MKNTLIKLLTIATLLLGAQAGAQDTLVDQLYEACETDVQSFCSQVTPGEGRMLHCMAAHEDKISGQCEYALYQAAALLEQLANAIVYVARECSSDIETICGDVKEGEGRILMCLEDNADDLSDTCTTALDDVTSD